MRAAVYNEFGGPIRVQEIPIPQVPHDGVLIQVRATGVCRSDWHGWKGHDGDVRAHGLPFVPGHEFSGVVVSKGSNVYKISPGDRVAVPFILSCGSCKYCSASKPTICSKQEQPGFTQFGSFAEYVAIPRADRNLRRLPDHVSFVQAAALGCRFTTAYRALYQQGRLKENQSVAIFGCGGLGLSCIMLAKAKRAKIIVAVDVSQGALEKALLLGATHAVNVSEDQASDQIAKLVQAVCPDTEDGVDLSLDAAGFITTSEAAVYATRPGGIMTQVGLPHGSPAIPMARVAGKEITIVGSHGFDPQILPELLDLVALGVDPCRLVHSEVTLEQGCAALENMDYGSPLGMVMITKFDSSSILPRL